ncbi:MAG: HlyD family type I secretion periplasmic adaptor subunit [Alphaproteobacteria bacterium]|nr:HlyD family type I secretion periplasmic adaptor subunit [Alphaproteobacteria bacterium]
MTTTIPTARDSERPLESVDQGGEAPARAGEGAITSVPQTQFVEPENNLAEQVRMPIIVGTVILGVFFGLLLIWGGLAPLAGGAYASGIVSPDGSRRTVQHLEGGIISELLVRDGDTVAAGDLLVVLRGTQARASAQVIMNRRRELSAVLARLRAEQMLAETIDFPADLLAAAERDPELADMIEGQRTLFSVRKAALVSQKDILVRRNAQAEAQIAGLEEQIASQTRQLALINKELEGVKDLVAKGLERQPRLLALQRSAEEITEGRAANQASIAGTRQAIGENELRILSVDTEFIDAVTAELEKARSELTELDERSIAAEDVLERTEIRAPVAGTVVELKFKTTGGVIAPGAPILDIVPAEEELLIDAYVSPTDIDVVRPGLRAKVMLTAFSQRNLPTVHGDVESVSADRITDERTGQAYYKARVSIERDELDRMQAEHPDVELTAGMPAEVIIVTVERTALDYLLGPFFASLGRAFRES